MIYGAVFIAGMIVGIGIIALASANKYADEYHKGFLAGYSKATDQIAHELSWEDKE